MTLAAGSGNTINLFGTAGSITVNANVALQVVFVGTVWYCIDTNALANSQGTLGVANGGLNTSTAPAVGSIPLASSTSAYAPLAIGGNGTVLTSNGTTASWAATSGASLSGTNTWTAANTFSGGITINSTVTATNGSGAMQTDDYQTMTIMGAL